MEGAGQFQDRSIAARRQDLPASFERRSGRRAHSNATSGKHQGRSEEIHFGASSGGNHYAGEQPSCLCLGRGQPPRRHLDAAQHDDLAGPVDGGRIYPVCQIEWDLCAENRKWPPTNFPVQLQGRDSRKKCPAEYHVEAWRHDRRPLGGLVMPIQKPIWMAVVVVLPLWPMTGLAQQGDQDGQAGQTTAIGAPGQEEQAPNQGQTPKAAPDPRSFSGAAGFSAQAPGGIRSYFQPSFQFSEMGDSNFSFTPGPQKFETVDSFIGRLDYLKAGRHSQTTAEYLGGGTIYNHHSNYNTTEQQ